MKTKILESSPRNIEVQKEHEWSDSSEFIHTSIMDLTELILKFQIKDKLLMIPKYDISTMVRNMYNSLDNARGTKRNRSSK